MQMDRNLALMQQAILSALNTKRRQIESAFDLSGMRQMAENAKIIDSQEAFNALIPMSRRLEVTFDKPIGYGFTADGTRVDRIHGMTINLEKTWVVENSILQPRLKLVTAFPNPSVKSKGKTALYPIDYKARAKKAKRKPRESDQLAD